MQTLKKVMYKAFGLHIVSEIAFPELPATKEMKNSTDVVIKQEALTDLWEELAGEKKYFLITKEFVMLRVPNTALFLIKEGREILFFPLKENMETQIKLYLLGSCMGILLMQRKILPLHGSAIAIDGKAYAIIGESGAGKSTLASAFLNNGYQLLSDDVIPISFSEEGIPIVTPAYPQQKLWQESLIQFGMDSDHYRPIFDRETKFTIPVMESFETQTMPLAGVFELVKAEEQEVSLQPIQKMNRFQTLYTHTYRQFFIAQAGLMEWHFDTSARVIEKIDLYQLQRPLSRFTAYELKNRILDEIKKGERKHGQ